MDIIKRHIPNVEFALMSSEVVSGYEVPMKKSLVFNPLKNPRSYVYLIESILINISMRVGINLPIDIKSPLYEYINCDMIINSGGDHLSGEFNKFGLSSYMNILCAILLRKPVILNGESLGYYTNPIFKFIACKILDRVDLIIVREKISKDYLDENLKNKNVYMTADPAFILEPASEARINDILFMEGIELKRPLIGINPSGLITKYTERQSVDVDLNRVFASIADKLIEDLNANILLIPHVYTLSSDDRIAIRQVLECIQNKNNVKIVNGEYTAEELKGAIGKCDLFIGARMHATIASTSMLVPTIGIAYSHKMHGIIGEMLNQQRYVIDVKELDYDLLEKVVYDAWENRFQIKKDLETIIPLVKEQSMQNGKYIKHLLDTFVVDNK